MKKSFLNILLFFVFLVSLSAQKSEKVAALADQESTLTIILKGSTLQLQNATVGAKIEILSIVGVRVFDKKIESSNQEYQLELPKGYYLVKIGTIVRKISLK